MTALTGSNPELRGHTANVLNRRWIIDATAEEFVEAIEAMDQAPDWLRKL